MAFTEVDLSTVTPYYGTTYSGGAIIPAGDYADFGLPGVTRDPAAYYEFVFDVTVNPSPSTTRSFRVFSSNGDPDTSAWWTLGTAARNGTLASATQSVSVIIGPGIEQGDSASGELSYTLETYHALSITGLRYRRVTAPAEVTVDVPLVFVADASVDSVAPVDNTISNPPRGGVVGSGSLADLDDVNYLHLWGTHALQDMPPGLDQFTYSLPALPTTGVMSVTGAILKFQAKLLPFTDGIVVLRDTGTEMTYTAWGGGPPNARMYTSDGQVTVQKMHFVFEEAAAFDLTAPVDTFTYAPSSIPLGASFLDWTRANNVSIFAWDGVGFNAPTAQLRLTQAFVSLTYMGVEDADAPVVAAAPVATVRVTPSLRMLQRGGSGGMSGIPRMIGDPTRRGIRQGPGSIY